VPASTKPPGYNIHEAKCTTAVSNNIIISSSIFMIIIVIKVPLLLLLLLLSLLLFNITGRNKQRTNLLHSCKYFQNF